MEVEPAAHEPGQLRGRQEPIRKTQGIGRQRPLASRHHPPFAHLPWPPPRLPVALSPGRAPVRGSDDTERAPFSASSNRSFPRASCPSGRASAARFPSRPAVCSKPPGFPPPRSRVHQLAGDLQLQRTDAGKHHAAPRQHALRNQQRLRGSAHHHARQRPSRKRHRHLLRTRRQNQLLRPQLLCPLFAAEAEGSVRQNRPDQRTREKTRPKNFSPARPAQLLPRTARPRTSDSFTANASGTCL